MGSGLTIEEKAIQLAAKKNMEQSGMDSPLNLNFAILNSVSPEYLEKIAIDSGITFHPAVGSSIHQISLMQAHDLAQARIAETNFKVQKELEARKKAEEQNKEVFAQETNKGKGVGTGDKGTDLGETRITRSKLKSAMLDQGSIFSDRKSVV